VTRGLHVGFRAPSREAVDAFWQAGIDTGYRDVGAPGRRTVYGPDYYGGFLLDPDGNSAEAVHTQRADPVPDGTVFRRLQDTCCGRDPRVRRRIGYRAHPRESSSEWARKAVRPTLRETPAPVPKGFPRSPTRLSGGCDLRWHDL
jgi:hypothetical protein